MATPWPGWGVPGCPQRPQAGRWNAEDAQAGGGLVRSRGEGGACGPELLAIGGVQRRGVTSECVVGRAGRRRSWDPDWRRGGRKRPRPPLAHAPLRSRHFRVAAASASLRASERPRWDRADPRDPPGTSSRRSVRPSVRPGSSPRPCPPQRGGPAGPGAGCSGAAWACGGGGRPARTMWYIMQSIQSKYSLSERLIRTIAAIRSFPRDNVEDLIGRGADVNCMHGTLKPLHCACMVADADCVELLLQKGAEVNALDGYNRTALHYAAEKDETCVEILLEYGANPNALDGNKDTPLHWAAFKNNAECVRSLLENGALVNARDYNNDTPLSWAAMKGNLESVSILLDFGAEVRVVNLKGQTPISRLVALLVRGLGTEREDSCFDLLHRAIGHFELRKNGSMPWEVTRDQQLCEKLTLLCSAPGTLQTLSRYAVRRSLGVRFLPEAVKQLPLPTCLKEYVLLLS